MSMIPNVDLELYSSESQSNPKETFKEYPTWPGTGLLVLP